MLDSEVVSLVMIAIAACPSSQERDPEPIANAWKLMLGDIPYAIAKPAVMQVIRASKFFPSVAEIVAAAELLDPRTDALPTAADAWGEVYRQIQYTGQYRQPVWTNQVIARAVGAMGWVELCQGENLEADRAHFLRIYESMRTGHKDRAAGNKALQLSGMDELVKALAGGMDMNKMLEGKK